MKKITKKTTESFYDEKGYLIKEVETVEEEWEDSYRSDETKEIVKLLQEEIKLRGL